MMGIKTKLIVTNAIDIELDTQRYLKKGYRIKHMLAESVSTGRPHTIQGKIIVYLERKNDFGELTPIKTDDKC